MKQETKKKQEVDEVTSKEVAIVLLIGTAGFITTVGLLTLLSIASRGYIIPETNFFYLLVIMLTMLFSCLYMYKAPDIIHKVTGEDEHEDK